MSEPPKGFITPPPGLLPGAPREVREGTDSSTRKLTRSAPVFFARPPGAPTADPAAAVPATAAPATAAPAAAAAAPVVPDDTVLVPRAASAHEPAVARWTLRTAEGVEHPVSASGLIVGRNPQRPEGWESAAVLGLFDPEKSVSKTHAALRMDEGKLYVLDLFSTNGTTVAFPDGTETRVAGDTDVAVPSGSTIGFGSYPMLALRS